VEEVRRHEREQREHDGRDAGAVAGDQRDAAGDLDDRRERRCGLWRRQADRRDVADRAGKAGQLADARRQEQRGEQQAAGE
jgi:hypothetical protein